MATQSDLLRLGIADCAVGFTAENAGVPQRRKNANAPHIVVAGRFIFFLYFLPISDTIRKLEII